MAFLAGGVLGLQLPLGGSQRLLCPHWVSAAPGNLAFSFVLTEDVLHERYARGGEDFYRLRNKKALDILSKAPETCCTAGVQLPSRTTGWPNATDSSSLPISTNLSDTPTVGRALSIKQYEAIDNLAAGYDRLHQSSLGIPWLRAKLESQQRAKVPFDQQYTTLANLGTLLIHHHLPGLMNGTEGALEGVQEGLKFIDLSIQAKPNAHFGREVWQARAVRTILRLHSDPKLRSQIDILGQPWMQGTPRRGSACLEPLAWARMAPQILAMSEGNFDLAARQKARALVPREGPVGFDEPALGLLGMWWFGGGPNPHLALALAGILERVGELPLAWVAYQRGIDLQEKFWADPELRTRFREHCQQRQAAIEEVLQRSHVDLKIAYEQRLRAGLEYQSQHRDPEAPDLTPRNPIEADYITVNNWLFLTLQFVSFGLLGAGLFVRRQRRFGSV